MKKEVMEDFLYTFQVILNWMVFENELPYLNFFDGGKTWDEESKSAIMGCFVPDSSFKRYQYNYDFFQWLMRTYPKESLDELIDFVHHEMTHHYCFMKHIEDTKDRFHTEAFKLAIERFNGSCRYVNDVYGWTDSRLNPEALETVKATLKYLNTNRINVKETKA